MATSTRPASRPDHEHAGGAVLVHDRDQHDGHRAGGPGDLDVGAAEDGGDDAGDDGGARPAWAPRPEATPKARARGRATIATVRPATRSCRGARARRRGRPRWGAGGRDGDGGRDVHRARRHPDSDSARRLTSSPSCSAHSEARMRRAGAAGRRPRGSPGCRAPWPRPARSGPARRGAGRRAAGTGSRPRSRSRRAARGRAARRPGGAPGRGCERGGPASEQLGLRLGKGDAGPVSPPPSSKVCIPEGYIT